ncbi:MAG: uracil phosphoribosyltransferase [Paludibacteraceae bacterium]|jgi:uracil phosphoribosyltransferase|nr:uracil phosphoribosyltransferase [Paludibacteraceae bacterium]
MQIYNLSERNSLLNNFLKEIRDKNIQKDSMRFRRNMERIAYIMAYEISKKLNYTTETIQTPLTETTINTSNDKIVVASILRAGIPFHNGILDFFDKAESAFISAYRKYDETHINFEIFVEYIASPSLTNKTLILCDPMLATGGSMELSYKALLSKGLPAHIHIVSVIASQKAIDFVKQHLPENATIWVAAIDPVLNEHSYIVPGLGDAGDLAFGEKL